MQRKRRACGLIAVFVALLAAHAHAADPAPKFAEGALQQLLGAIQARALDRFIALGDEGFKAMPEAEFEKLATRFAPMLGSGYAAAYLGEFRQRDSTVYYWKLTFTSDPDDYLVKLGVRDGKLRGFLIQRP